jgi:RNA polymerase sigma factor (sigma-70 family)
LTIIPLQRPDAQPGDANSAAAGDSRAGDTAGRHDGLVSQSARAQPAVARREALAPTEEAELVRRLASGEHAALTAITEWLWEPLAAYAYRLVEDRDAALDIAQEACVRLWERRRQSPRCLRAYLFRITRNLALDHLKTRRTRRRLLRGQEPGRVTRPARPDEVLECDRVSAEVQRAIQRLPERRREVFTLTYLRGLSYAQVGEVMEISPKTVQNQMTAALAQLRTELRPLLDELHAVDGPATGKNDA